MVKPGIVKMIVSIIALVWLLCSTTAMKVPVTLTEVTTPTIKFNSYVWSMISHPGDSQLLIITDLYAVWTFNQNTKQKTLIAGSTSSGYQEGRAENARFDSPGGSAHFNDSTIIVTDSGNRCVRLVNLETRWTERYAGVCKSSGYKDGNRLTAKFNWMWGITRLGNDFYLCETAGQRLRRLSGNTVSTVTSVTNLFRGLTSAGNKLLYTLTHGFAEFDLDSITTRILSGTTNAGSTDGSLSSALFWDPFDVISLTDTVFLVADTSNSAVRIVDLNNKTVSSITVSSDPHSLLLYNGDVLAGIDGGKIEKFPIKQLPVDLGADISCDSDKTLSLPTSDYVVLFVPNVTSSDSVVCTNCPSDQNLTFGVHRFAYKYYNHLRNYSKTCDQTVTVNPDAVTLKCPENLKLSLSRDSPGINLTLPQPDVNGTRLECINCPPANQFLSEGVHDMRYIYQDQLTKLNFSCGYLINIKKPALICHKRSKMQRRAFLEAEYLFDCTSLSRLAVSIIESNAKQHTTYLHKYCPGCRVNVSSPEIKCLDDKLILIWETEVTGSQQVAPSDMRKKLEDSLVQFHVKHSEMDISVLRTTPRVVSPVRLKSGLYLNIVVQTSCLENGYIYNSQTDTCEKMTVCPAVIQCPKHMDLILPRNVNELNFTLPQPQVNETRLSCINCPDGTQTLDEGVHNVYFTYMDTVYNKTISCEYTINVIKQSTPVCQNETRRLFIRSGQNKTDEVQFGDTGAIRFDVGVHEVKIRDDCIITYIVNEMSNMERRVELQAEYPVKCSTLKSVSFSVINSQLLVHTQYLQKYCPVCQLDASPNPEVTCTNDTLISTWKTGFSGDNQVLNENIKNKLNTALIQFRNKYPIMDVTVISTLPRLDVGISVRCPDPITTASLTIPKTPAATVTTQPPTTTTPGNRCPGSGDVSELQIRLIRYSNPSDTDVIGDPCDSSSSCDLFFQICLSDYPQDDCSLYYYSSPVLVKGSTILFNNQIGAIENPIIIPIDPGRWKGVSLTVKVWDKDDPPQSDEPVDEFRYDFTDSPGSAEIETLDGIRQIKPTQLLLSVELKCPTYTTLPSTSTTTTTTTAAPTTTTPPTTTTTGVTTPSTTPTIPTTTPKPICLTDNGYESMSINFVNFSNPTDKKAVLLLCDGDGSNCDVYLEICISEVNMSDCSIYNVKTNFIEEGTLIFFSSNIGGYRNPLEIYLGTRNRTGVNVKVVIWDRDTQNIQDDQVDQFNFDFFDLPGAFPRTITVDSDRAFHKTQLALTVRRFCPGPITLFPPSTTSTRGPTTRPITTASTPRAPTTQPTTKPATRTKPTTQTAATTSSTTIPTTTEKPKTTSTTQPPTTTSTTRRTTSARTTPSQNRVLPACNTSYPESMVFFKMISFSNPDDTIAQKQMDGTRRRCDRIFGFEPADDYCDLMFKICISQLSGVSDCRYYDNTTGNLGETKKLDFIDFNILINPGFWQGIKVEVKVWDWDSPFGARDNVDSFTYFYNESDCSQANNQGQAMKGRFQDKTRLEVLFGCACKQFYYGNQCEKYCNPNGQPYNCDARGRRVYPADYKGNTVCVLPPKATLAPTTTTETVTTTTQPTTTTTQPTTTTTALPTTTATPTTTVSTTPLPEVPCLFTIVSPVKDSEGLNVRVVVTTICLDKGFIYNKQYDVCEKVI